MSRSVQTVNSVHPCAAVAAGQPGVPADQAAVWGSAGHPAPQRSQAAGGAGPGVVPSQEPGFATDP